MKKVFILAMFVLGLLVLQFASAEIIINQQPEKIYNIGDSVVVPITIKTIAGVSGIYSMDLICANKQVNFYKNGVNLIAGEEKTMEASLVLTKDILGENVGTCKMKGILLNEYILTNEFKISNILTIQPNTEQKEYEPGQSVLIFGNSIKENGHDVNGFIDMEIVMENSSKSIIQPGTINNGMYSMNITFPKDIAAGNYLIKLNAYELAIDGTKTNKGFVNYNIGIKQVPNYLELVFETKEVEPGTNVMVKSILHDQTGERINSKAIMTVKRGLTEIQFQSEKQTDEYLEFPIAYNEPSSNWTVFAISNQLTAEAQFTVIEKMGIGISIINETVTFINTGNIPYNESVFIKIGNKSIEVPVFLEIDGTQKYELKAPNGEYEVEILSDGESKLKQSIILTGRTIGIKNMSKSNIKGFFGSPVVWIFIALILLSIAFIILRKAYKKNPYGGLFKKKVKQPKINTAWENRAMLLSKNSKLETKNKASLSLSIKGNKQEISLVNVSIRNLAEVQNKKGNPEEPLQKIINLAENKKAFVYENQNNLFFILTPSKTRTLKNENIAFEIAQDAKEILSSHNKITKYRLDFGISIEYGSIVEKTEKGVLEFMSLENLMTNSKRISSASQGEVLLGEKIRDKLTSVRTERQENGKTVFYKIKDIKYHDEEHSRYIKSFLKKAEENNPVNTNPSNKPAPFNTNTENKNSTDPKSLIKGFY